MSKALMGTLSFLISLSLPCWFLSCDPLDGGGTDPIIKDSTDSATVVISNKVTQNPISYRLLIFTINANNENVTYQYRSSEIETDSTRTFKIPAGQWKLGLEDKLGGRFPMIVESGSINWPHVQATKGATYTILLYTDLGNNNLWRTNFISSLAPAL